VREIERRQREREKGLLLLSLSSSSSSSLLLVVVLVHLPHFEDFSKNIVGRLESACLSESAAGNSEKMMP